MVDLAEALQKLVTASPDAKKATRYNTDIVRRAWDQVMSARRRARRLAEQAARAAAGTKSLPMDYDDLPVPSEVDRDPLIYSYVHQLWTDHIIVSADNNVWYSVTYSVAEPGASASDVTFGEPQRVKETFVAASAGSAGGQLLAEFTASGEIVGSPLDRILAASAASIEGVALSAPPWAKPGDAGKKSSEGKDGGLSLKSDATLGPGHQAITNAAGKRVGVVKKVGDKFTHSQDNHSQKFDSAEGAKRVFAVKHKASDGAGHGKADGEGKHAEKPGEQKKGNPFAKGD